MCWLCYTYGCDVSDKFTVTTVIQHYAEIRQIYIRTAVNRNRTLLFSLIYAACFSCVDLQNPEKIHIYIKVKSLPQEAVEMAQGGLGRLRPQISLTFGTTRVSLTHRLPLPPGESLVLIF